ncbi:PLC-like phosphodiesterase [Aspergillus karnatakaensis]|uniref:putative phosphoinositide-specific phospholipase C n=1 Tax=Aspergillus karnatakaensis TaxID=1810916 RepID=UPI003CCE182A
MATVDEVTAQTGQIAIDPSAQAFAAKPITAFSPSFKARLDQVYKSLADSKSNFLNDIQRDAHSSETTNADPLSSLAAFHAYMAGPAASALRPASQPDISAPISDYFISSSHNTYLTGNQLYSDAAAKAYTDALLDGCRCVEIDVWDGELDSDSEDGTSVSSSDDEKPSKPKELKNSVKSKFGSILRRKSKSPEKPTDRISEKQSEKPANERKTSEAAKVGPLKPEPQVLHGHTLTKGTTFREVCYAIRDSAFAVSDLPVIVSLEVHASFEQQETMVEIMEDAFKGLLIEITPEMEALEAMPPLSDLKRKILLKVKWVPPSAEGQDDGDDKTDDLEQLAQTNSTASQPPQKPAKILHTLSRLAVFTKGFSFKQFSQPEAKVTGHVFSLSERAARQADERFSKELFEHNRKHFMRVYPYGLRVNSSNLDPTFFWRRGAQIVALNWQNADKGMMLNQGMFAGEQGWILKPQGYRSTEPEAAPIPRHTVDLSIEVLAGQELALPPGDKNEKGFKPYVACYLHVETPEDAPNPKGDDSTDSEKTSYKRVVKAGEGSNPDFGGQKIVFPTLAGVVEELTFVRFKVKDDEIGRDSLASWACIRLTRLQEGYRVIRLFKADGSHSGGFLLVRITKTVS